MENIFQNFAAGVGAHTLHTHSAESNGRLLVPKKKSDWLVVWALFRKVWC